MKTMRWLASGLKNEAYELARRLSVPHSGMQAIKLRHPKDVREQIIDVLTYCRNRMSRFPDSASILAAELVKCKRLDLAELLRQQKQNTRQSSHEYFRCYI
ncbi:UNVERIFIED_CONTAM: hypothetical protein FKN15_055472 [Acipenser sinensis]